MIAEFEKWIQPRIEKGHLKIDVIAAYCRTFPGRTIGLITNLYTHYDNRRQASEQVRGVQDTTDAHGEGGS